MINTNHFDISFYIDDKELKINETMFNYFEITEELEKGVYYATLSLRNYYGIFKNIFLLGGEKFKIIINHNIEKKSNTLNLVVFDIAIIKGNFNLTLIPEAFVKLEKDKISKGYTNKFEEIVKEICGKFGLKYDIENSTSQARNWYQLDMGYISFIRKHLKYVSSNNGSGIYCFFLNKEDKFLFHSYDYIKNKKVIANIKEKDIGEIVIQNRTFAYQMTGGFGNTIVYFDWESGKMIKRDLEYTTIDKVGMNKEYKSNDNIILSYPAIGNDFLFTEKMVLTNSRSYFFSKNIFNQFITFTFQGVFDFTPLEKINFTMVDGAENEENKLFTGDWVIYAAKHFYSLNAYASTITLGNSFLFNVKNEKYI